MFLRACVLTNQDVEEDEQPPRDEKVRAGGNGKRKRQSRGREVDAQTVDDNFMRLANLMGRLK